MTNENSHLTGKSGRIQEGVWGNRCISILTGLSVLPAIRISLKKKTMFTYDTVSEAVSGLKKRGFSTDFNLKENCLVCHGNKFNPEDFEIVEVYRFEGNSDPSDEAVVYAIESRTGMKGVLVNGYGVSADPLSSDMAKKLSVNRKS